jgi:hypothetical protein
MKLRQALKVLDKIVWAPVRVGDRKEFFWDTDIYPDRTVQRAFFTCRRHSRKKK